MYKGYSRIGTRTALGSYDRAMPRSIGLNYGLCVSAFTTYISRCEIADSSATGVPRTLCGGTSLIRDSFPQGPYSRTMTRVL